MDHVSRNTFNNFVFKYIKINMLYNNNNNLIENVNIN